MALEVVGSTPITHPTFNFRIFAVLGFSLKRSACWDVAKLVRHRILVPAFRGFESFHPSQYFKNLKDVGM